MSSATSARWGPWIWGLLAAVAARVELDVAVSHG